MKTVIGFCIGCALEEISSSEHWFGDPHAPWIVILSWSIIGGGMWIFRRPITAWVES